MSRLAFALILAVAALRSQAQDVSPLAGTIEDDGNTYVSPTGAFKVAVPLTPGMGGSITDNANVVIFQDPVNLYVTIAAQPMDATQRWELSNRQTKDYLVYFFSTFVVPVFRQQFKDAVVENSATFLPRLEDGALIAYVLVPNGSMFSHQLVRIDPEAKVRPAKRGNLLFVKNGTIFVLSMELAERVTEGTAYTLTTEQENELLRERLLGMLHKIQFPKAPDAAPPALPAPAG
jgi:hypothetical protein